MTTVVVPLTSDATASETGPANNYSTAGFLTVEDGSEKRPFVHAGRPFPLGATIESAVLRFRQYKTASSASRTLTAQPVAAAWSESKITWNNQPGVSGPTATEDASGVGSDGRLIEFDVTAAMQAVAAGAPWYGFRIVSSSSSQFRIYSSESKSGMHPVLEVTYSTAPAKPANLSPSAGRAVSIPLPTLAFDHNASTALAAYQVQLNDSDEWTSPDTDTGWVSSTVPLHTLTADVDVDEVVFWRVRTRDTAGVESPWSDAVSFTRKAKPVVTITNPAASPNDYVTEPTPPFSWSSDAATQTGFRVLVTDPLDPSVIVWDSGRQGGAGTSITPPSDLPLATGRTYRLEVRVEDAIARQATPGDPIYGVAEREFTFQLSASVDPVTGLAVTQLDARPWATLSWTSATAPDGFEILRRVVATGAETSLGVFDAADLLDSGTTYTYVDREAAPQAEHEFEVRRIVNGETSDANPTDTITLRTTGTWLCSLDGVHVIRITTEGSRGPIRWGADERVEIIRPYGGSQVHAVTHAIFGRQGSLDGFVKPFGGQSLAEARAAVAALRPPVSPYGTPMILSQADEAVRVFWVGVVTDPRHDFVEKFGISADIHEVHIHGAA